MILKVIGCVYKAYSNRCSLTRSFYKLWFVRVTEMESDGRRVMLIMASIYFVLSGCESRVALLVQLDNLTWLHVKIEAMFSGLCFNISHLNDDAISLLSKKSDCLVQQLENWMFKFLKIFRCHCPLNGRLKFDLKNSGKAVGDMYSSHQ